MLPFFLFQGDINENSHEWFDRIYWLLFNNNIKRYLREGFHSEKYVYYIGWYFFMSQ